MSRQYGLTIDGVEKQCVIPYADMFNHQCQPDNINAEWMYNETEDRFVIVASENIEIGKQINISYGEKTNQELFLNYGFVPDENINDVVLLTLKLDRDLPMYSEKYTMLSSDWHAQSFYARANLEDNYVESMIMFARFIVFEEHHGDTDILEKAKEKAESDAE